VLSTVLIPALVSSISKTIMLAVRSLQAAVPSIFAAMSFLGPVGIVGAGVAIAGMMALYRSVGDLAMGANGGPIVTNPREGTIFQGTKNDEVAMGPGVINAAQGGGTTSVVQQGSSSDAGLIQETNNLLRQLIQAARTPVPVQIGDTAIERIGSIAAAKKSYGN
jgi:hypothetical protein